MRLPRLDVIFGLASPAVDILVEDTGVAELQVRDDEARVWPFRADFDARDDPLDAAPARSSVEELLEAAELAVLGRSLKARPWCWPRGPQYAGAMSWSARRPGCNRGRWPCTSQELRDSNNGYRRAAGSWCLASWRGSLAAGAAGKRESPCRRAG